MALYGGLDIKAGPIGAMTSWAIINTLLYLVKNMK